MPIDTVATVDGVGGYQHDATEALQWIAYAGKVPVDTVLALDLNYEQLVTLGSWLANNPLINPPMNRVAKSVKRNVFQCQCGCGESFVATWRTSKPKYKDAAHKQRAYRKRCRQQSELSR